MIGTLLLASALQASAPPAPTGPAIYQKNCALCHEQSKATRAPDRDTMKQRSPEAILASLVSGSMATQGGGLSEAEKRAVAEYLSGKAFGAVPAPVESGMCPNAGAPLGDPAKSPAWTGWGGD